MQSISFVLIFVTLVLAQLTYSFKIPSTRRFGNSLSASIDVGSANEIPNGERKIVDTSAGTVIVANVDGKYFLFYAYLKF